VVTNLQVTHTGSDLLHDARALVAADDRHRHPGEVAGADVVIGMAQAGGLEGHQHFAFLWTIEIYVLDTPFLIDIPQHGGIHLHANHPHR
jgi:hypothetical protein